MGVDGEAPAGVVAQVIGDRVVRAVRIAGLRLDADNVAKAALDALTGLVWRDDRQVTRLTVEKLADGPARIVLMAEPVEMAAASGALDAILSNAGLTGPGGLVR